MGRILLSWSSGKDSAWALHTLRRQGVEVAGLLTTLNQEFNRVAMHGVRQALLEAQAREAGLPLWQIPLPWPCSNAQYEGLMSDAMARAKSEGIETVAFGDLFLEDIRGYREQKMAQVGMKCLFPLWGRDTRELAYEMIEGGLKARLVCVDTKQLDIRFAGREFDADLLRDLPEGVDPCGERGEFHTFTYASPTFRAPIAHKAGETVLREGFAFADVLPA
jgi:uncharacterized protein (TIGR00290 family)